MRGEGIRIRGLASALALLVCARLAFHATTAHAIAPHGASAHRVEIRAASLASSANTAALTIELDRATSYKLFTLDDPARVVLDLGDSQFAQGIHLPHADGVIERLRAGARPHGGLRIVLQLDASAAPHGHDRLPVHAQWRRRCTPTPSHTHRAACLVVEVGEGATSTAHPTRAASSGSIAARVALTDLPESAKVTRASLTTRVPETERASANVLRPIPVPHAPALDDRDVIIAVDAGHGGKDSGAIGRNGTEEKDVTLAIARALAARINDEPGMRAVLTRDSDVFLLLKDRRDRARDAHADLFVSVHADSIHDPAVSGASVYVLSERGATDEAARWLADRENAADRLGGVPLADKSSSLASLLIDLAQTENISASTTAAQGVLAALTRVGEVRKPLVQQARFVVLKSPDMPSMLVETAYISNPGDERRLRTAREQRKLADAIFKGLRGYFEEHPPAGTRFARLLRNDSNAELAGASLTPGSHVAPDAQATDAPIAPAGPPGSGELAARP